MNGIWGFSSENYCSMLNNPSIKSSIQAKNNAIVYDFLVYDRKKSNKICTILDLCVEDEEANEISRFFCNTINDFHDIGDLNFKFEKHGRNVRIILSGADEVIMEILDKYYSN